MTCKSAEMLEYTKPAADFNSALPIGNGRIGGMIYGIPDCELIHLNEDSVWSGGFRNRNNPTAKERLGELRSLVSQGRQTEAEELVKTAFTGLPSDSRHYMPLGDLFIRQTGLDEISNYRRRLDLSRAAAATEFDSAGTHFLREYFVSAPDNVLVVRLLCNEPKNRKAEIYIDGRDGYYDENRPLDESTLVYSGGSGGENAICFSSYLRVAVFGENSSMKFCGNKIIAENCAEILILLGVRTSFYCNDFSARALADCEKAEKIGFKRLLERHVEDYEKLYCRCGLSLCDNSGAENIDGLETDSRIMRLADNFAVRGNDEKKFALALESDEKINQDNKLIELYFNFSRYLMISGSREGTLPLNLQGIWNKDMWPAWGGRYTLNINLEMNYWPVEILNLSECHLPLFDLLDRIRINGRKTAEEMYGCGGFCCHHNTDLWGDTAPQDIWLPATLWPMGGAWLCLHIAEHFRFSGDMDFLRDKFAVLKEACEFYSDFLFEDKSGKLVVCPSLSPENTYIAANGEKASICESSAIDCEIIRALFIATINACKVLNIEPDFAASLHEMLKKLPDIRIDDGGRIAEWNADYDEAEPGHRHISQLFALCPDDSISINETPELAAAARATIERRLKHGGGHTGWSRAWLINLWARLGEGERVYSNLLLLLGTSTYPNLFDAHPPFQIDGNFGGACGIAEALMQSNRGIISLLPALPRQWNNGSVKGFVARGGFVLDFDWKNTKIECGVITSRLGGFCRIKSPTSIEIFGRNGELLGSGTDIGFLTEIGNDYRIAGKKI